MEEIIPSTPEEQLQWMKSKFKQVKSTVKDLENFLNKFESIRNRLDDENDWLEVNLDWAKRQKEEIDKLYTETSQTVEKIKTEIDAKTKELNTVEELLKTAKTNAGQSQILKDEISGLKSTSKNDANSISILLKNFQENSNKINSLLGEAETNVTNIQNFLSTFNNLKWQIEDKEKGFEATIGKINEDISEADWLLVEIRGILTNSNKNLTEIENEKKIVLENSEKVKEFKLKSEEDYNEIRKYLDIASDASFSESFKDRKWEHSRSAIIWMVVLIVCVVLLTLYLVWIFFPYLKSKGIELPWLETTIFRVSLSSPLLFFIWFAWSEYSKSKKNEEKYAFKFASSSVFRNHIKFMLDEFWEDKKWEVLETTQKIIEMLYTPTYPSEDKISKTEKEILETYTNKKWKKSSQQNFDDIINRIQKIKDIWFDTEILKIIIPLIFK